MEILFSVTSLSNGTNSIDKLSGFELPDGPLLLLDRLNLKHNIISNINAQYARQNQGSNDTSTSSRRCTCNLGVCKCCTGLLLDLFNQKACMKVTYHPGDFAFDVAMSFNDRVLYENSVSGMWVILVLKSPRMFTKTFLKDCFFFCRKKSKTHMHKSAANAKFKSLRAIL